MFTAQFQYQLNFGKLYKRVDKAKKIALREEAKLVQKEAKRLVNKKERSRPGNPPGRKTGNLYKSIRYSVQKSTALVGASWPSGAHGQLLTWGRSPSSKTGAMLPRPFMQPALEKVRSQLASKWSNVLTK